MQGTLDSQLRKESLEKRRGGLLDILQNAKVKKFVLDHTPEYLRDLVKVLGHEGLSLKDYGRPGMFSNIAIETTSICNRECGYCPVSDRELYKGRRPKPMADATFENVIGQLAKASYRGTVALQHYGEPLLDKKIDARIAYIREKLPGAFIVMNSNGDYLNPKRLIDLVERGIDLIHVTNHNVDGTVEPGLQETQKYVSNHPELKKHFKMRDGVSSFYNRGGLIQENMIPIQSLTKTQAPAVKRLSHCVDESYSANVDADGNVVLCANDFVGEHRYGNVNDRSVIDIWYDDKFVSVRSRKKRGHFDLPICQRCVGG